MNISKLFLSVDTTPYFLLLFTDFPCQVIQEIKAVQNSDGVMTLINFANIGTGTHQTG